MERWAYRKAFNSGSSRLWRNECKVFHWLRDILQGKCRSYLAFSADWWPSGLLPYLDQERSVRGIRKFWDVTNRLGIWELADALCWFLRAVNPRKVRLDFLYDCFRLVPDARYSILVWFYSPWRRTAKKHCEGSLPSWQDVLGDNSAQIVFYPTILPFIFLTSEYSWVTIMYLETQDTKLDLGRGKTS